MLHRFVELPLSSRVLKLTTLLIVRRYTPAHSAGVSEANAQGIENALLHYLSHKSATLKSPGFDLPGFRREVEDAHRKLDHQVRRSVNVE